eukprot:8373833-Karenia_brevis.AAC.1
MESGQSHGDDVHVCDTHAPEWESAQALAHYDQAWAELLPAHFVECASALVKHGILGSTDYSGGDMAVDAANIAIRILASASGTAEATSVKFMRS